MSRVRTYEIKKCATCGKMKPIVAKEMCRKCYDLEQKPTYYKENREKILKKRKEYYNKNKSEIIKRVKEYTINNPERVFERRKKHREKNKESIRIEHEKWRENNKELISKYMKKYRLTNNGKKHEAKRRQLGWIPLFKNPFPKEIKSEYHHINNLLVVPIPSKIHKKTYTKNTIEHRERANLWLFYLYGIDFNNLFLKK